jgi:hypothetical protein
MHNRLYYQEDWLAYLEAEFFIQDYWNDQYSLIFENHRHKNVNNYEILRSQSLSKIKSFRKTPWDGAF